MTNDNAPNPAQSARERLLGVKDQDRANQDRVAVSAIAKRLSIPHRAKVDISLFVEEEAHSRFFHVVKHVLDLGEFERTLNDADREMFTRYWKGYQSYQTAVTEAKREWAASLPVDVLNALEDLMDVVRAEEPDVVGEKLAVTARQRDDIHASAMDVYKAVWGNNGVVLLG